MGSWKGRRMMLEGEGRLPPRLLLDRTLPSSLLGRSKSPRAPDMVAEYGLRS